MTGILGQFGFIAAHIIRDFTNGFAWLAEATQVASWRMIRFLDFCAGIGSTRFGFEKCGAECVGFSEIDIAAETTYRLFHGEQEINYGDLMTLNPRELPEFDVMLGGFPCQTFSIMGKRHGLSDSRGMVFEGLTQILKAKKPAAFMLENVKGLLNHDNGRTFQIIFRTLEDAGYQVSFDVLRSSDFGIPQMRERCFLVGFRDRDIKFEFPKSGLSKPVKLSQLLIDESPAHEFNFDSTQGLTFNRYLNNAYNRGAYSVADLLNLEGAVIDTRQSDLRIYQGIVPTLRTGRQGILYVRNGALRSLSGLEALLLQGFPLKYAKKASEQIPNSKLLAQAGNAMTVNVVEAIASRMTKVIAGRGAAFALAA